MADDSERAASTDPGGGSDAGHAGHAGHGTGNDAGNGKREFRTAELAELAGITTRTLRFYRERKLLPPPRRDGRIAWYDEHHLARLRTISGLLARGHTLGGIADLLGAFESGRDSHGTAELLGLESSMITLFAEETPIRLTPEELADYYQGEVTVENLAASLDIGYIAVDGDEFIHISRRLLDASSALVKKGIPLAAVLAAGRGLRTQTEAIAEVFADLFRTHLLPAEAAAAADGGLDADCLNDLLTQLRPLAKQVVEAELGLALDRRVRAEVEQWIGQTGHPTPEPDAPANRPGPGPG